MSHFSSISRLPDDPIFGIQTAFNADPNPKKVNLGVGAYRNEEGKPIVLSCMRKAEKNVFEKQLNKEYLPIAGAQDFLNASLQLVFGSPSDSLFAVQALGGTGALRLGGELLARNQIKTIYVPAQTWLNHHKVFGYAGMNVETYPYFDAANQRLDFPNMCAAIEKMPAGAIILLHVSCHNPTGIDPSQKQWRELSSVIKKRKIIPFFDLAYGGLGQGWNEDLFSLRHFVAEGHELLLAVSYSKIFGVYGERVGFFAAHVCDAEVARSIGSHLKVIVRANYSNPPLHGERLVAEVLQSEPLKQEWLKELEQIRLRIGKMRQHLSDGLQNEMLNHQKGMFAFIPLQPGQLERLAREFGIYMADGGRINLAGLNGSNIEYVISSLRSVVHR